MKEAVQLSLIPRTAAPFLKWAGGKSQLLRKMESFFPEELKRGRIVRYVEPFVGGGAVFFYIAQKYRVEELVIADVNPELILAYRTVRADVASLIDILSVMERDYLSLGEDERSEYFYDVRSRFNEDLPKIDFSASLKSSPDWIVRTAQLIFLNRTCFNGLFRVNSQGEFNVPFGNYKNPTICNRERLESASHLLQSAHIHLGDFEGTAEFADENSFVYLDPPYRPISSTASFTSYQRDTFDDSEQLRLASFYEKMSKAGAKLMLSNSDPKNEDPEDDFFERAYRGYRIERVKAKRNINCDGDGRGPVNELLILNY